MMVGRRSFPFGMLYFPGGGYVKLPGVSWCSRLTPENTNTSKSLRLLRPPTPSFPWRSPKWRSFNLATHPGFPDAYSQRSKQYAYPVWWDHSAPTGHLHSPASIALILLGETARMHCNKSRRQEGSTKHLMRICRQHILRIFHYCKSEICEKTAHFTVINTSNLFKERRNRCPKLIKTSTPNTKSNISKATPFQEIFQPTICGGWMLPKHA